MPSVSKSVGSVVVVRTQVIGSRTYYSAYEPYAGHSSLMHTHEGKAIGRIGCRKLPAELDALKPYSEERARRVRAWKEAEREEAYALIVEAFPEAATGVRTSGEIETESR